MPRIDDLPSTFSRGLKQKAAITMAFVRPFDVMLIDEPFVGLDPISMGVLVALIRQLNDASGLTSIVVSHDVAETASIASAAASR